MILESSSLSVSKIQRLQILCLAAFVTVALLFSPVIAGAVLVGGLISLLSFAMLKRDVRQVFGGQFKDHLRKGKVRFLVKYYLRLLLLAVVLFVLVRHHIFNFIGLLAGLSIPMCCTILAGLGYARKLHVNAKEVA